MAGESVIGALRVVLGLDTASYEEGLKGASAKADTFAAGLSNRFSSLASGVAKTFTVIGVAAAAAVAGLGYAVEQTIDKIDHLGKSAQKAGVPIEEFSKLSTAAGKSGVGVDELTSALDRLSRNLSQIAGGNQTSDAAKAFEVLGLSVKDASGKMKTTQQIVTELADKFTQFADGPNKSALAIALFGRAGAELIPFLNKGSAGLRETAAEMENLGTVIDLKTFKAAEQFKKSLNSLNSVVDSVVLRITIGALPALQGLALQFTSASKEAKNWEGTAFLVDNAVKLITTGFIGLSAIFNVTTETFGKFIKAVSQAVTGDFAGAWRTLSSGTSILDTFSKTLEGMKTVWGIAGKDVSDYKDSVAEVDKALANFPSKKPEAPALPLGSLTKALDDLKLKTREANDEFIALPQGLYEAGKALGLVQGGADKLTTNFANLSPEMQKLALATAAFKGAQLVEADLQPWQLYEQQLARINTLYVLGGISAAEAAVAAKKAAESTQQAWYIASVKIAGDVASGLQAFAGQSKAFALAYKAAAIAQATIATYVAATKAIEIYGPTPIGFAAAAAAIVAGIGNVAKITAQQFAAGGSFKVPGGISGVDSKFTPLMLAPGEQVDITPASRASSGAGPAEVRIPSSSLRSILMTGDNLRELVEGLNSAHSDGYRLVFAE